MQVRAGLLIFAVNVNNPTNSFVLLKDELKNGKDYLRIPSDTLPDDSDSLSLIYRIIKECSGVTGRWIEMTPKQVGVFDDVDRNPDFREIFIAYSLYVPEPMAIYKGYKWVKLDELEKECLDLDTEQIIMYAILGGDKYAF